MVMVVVPALACLVTLAFRSDLRLPSQLASSLCHVIAKYKRIKRSGTQPPKDLLSMRACSVVLGTPSSEAL